MSLRFAILGFLSIRPMSGYDLKRTFDASVRHFWTADQAGIYRALGELQQDGLVTHERIEQQARPDRKVFSITPAGSAALDGWLAEPAVMVPRREPLLVKLFFLSRLEPAALLRLLDAELSAVDAELASYREIVDALAASPAVLAERTAIGPLVTLGSGVRYAIGVRRWLQEVHSAVGADTLSAAALLAGLQADLRPG